MRIVKLEAIGIIFSGLVVARLDIDGPDAVSRRVVTLKDVADRLPAPLDLDVLALPTGQADRFALARGDVVVTARSATVRAAVVREEHEAEGVILGANLFAVRLRPGGLSPTLLAAYLRLPATQAILLGRRKGAAVPGMTVGELGRLEVALPPDDHQESLVRLVELTQRQREAVLSAVDLRMKACADVLSRALTPVRGA